MFQANGRGSDMYDILFIALTLAWRTNPVHRQAHAYHLNMTLVCFIHSCHQRYSVSRRVCWIPELETAWFAWVAMIYTLTNVCYFLAP